MTTQQHGVAFTSAAKGRLMELGVNSAQVAELEKPMFFTKHSLLPRPAPQDVRDALDEVKRGCELLERGLNRLAAGATPASTEAGNWFAFYLERDPAQGAAQGFDDMPRPDHHGALAEAAKRAAHGRWAYKMAVAEVAGQRQRRIDTAPITSIAVTLCMHRTPGRRVIRPSKEPGSAFSQIVSICIAQAVGGVERDHERAIRAYLKEQAEREDEYRDDTDSYS